jgi:small subunit ribosomal protein S13
LDKLSIPLEKKVKDLTDKEIKAITDELRWMVLENDLRREVSWAIKRLKEIKSYRGMRHNLWLPVRWQKTKVNSKTAKKLLWRSRVRPVLKK